MGYRFGYLLVRTGYRSLKEPTATGMVWGYLAAVARRKERLPDEDVRRHLRKQQSLTALPRRAREALGTFPLGLTRRGRAWLSRMRTADSPRHDPETNGT